MIWTIAPDDPQKLEDLRQGEELSFPILVDEGAEVTRAYGILNEKMPKIPHPTAIVVDKEGVMRYVRVDVDYTVRPEPEEILEALGTLP